MKKYNEKNPNDIRENKYNMFNKMSPIKESPVFNLKYFKSSGTYKVILNERAVRLLKLFFRFNEIDTNIAEMIRNFGEGEIYTDKEIRDFSNDMFFKIQEIV